MSTCVYWTDMWKIYILCYQLLRMLGLQVMQVRHILLRLYCCMWHMLWAMSVKVSLVPFIFYVWLSIAKLCRAWYPRGPQSTPHSTRVGLQSTPLLCTMLGYIPQTPKSPDSSEAKAPPICGMASAQHSHDCPHPGTSMTVISAHGMFPHAVNIKYARSTPLCSLRGMVCNPHASLWVCAPMKIMSTIESATFDLYKRHESCWEKMQEKSKVSNGNLYQSFKKNVPHRCTHKHTCNINASFPQFGLLVVDVGCKIKFNITDFIKRHWEELIFFVFFCNNILTIFL